MSKIAGYCQLCRAKEIKLYNDRLANTEEEHIKACTEAGCKHPAYYDKIGDISSIEKLAFISLKNAVDKPEIPLQNHIEDTVNIIKQTIKDLDTGKTKNLIRQWIYDAKIIILESDI